MLQGFDGPLAFAVFLLACAGLLTMYSSGFDHGTRFVDHGRNMLIAGSIMFVVAQVPPQRLMSFAVPLYMVGVALLVAVAVFGITKKGAQALGQRGHRHPAQRDPEDRHAADAGLVVPEARRPVAAAGLRVGRLLLVVPVGLIMKQPDLGTAHAGAGGRPVGDLLRRPVVEADRAAGAAGPGRRCPADRVRAAAVRRRRALAGPARLPAAAHLHPARPHARTRWAKASTSSRG